MFIAPWPVHLDVDEDGHPVLVPTVAEAGDPDPLPPTVAPAVVDELGGLPVRTPALRPGLL